MKAIILAAGYGSRLKPLTNNTPKSLLTLNNNERILDRTLRILRKKGLSDISLVVGYKHEQFDEYKDVVKIYHNPFFAVSNSIVSLWFAKENLDEDVIILNSDVIFSEELLQLVLDSKSEAAVLLDSSVKKTADYKVDISDNKVTVMSKELDSFFGEYIGITTLKKESALILKRQIDKMISKELLNEWYETALVELIFTEDFKLSFVDVCEEHWIEIDNINDLALAKKMAKKE